MTKKIFALASVTALTGAVTIASTSAGCSSSPSGPDDAGSSGSTQDVKNDVIKPDTGTSSGEEAGPDKCPTTDVIDATTFPWKPPSQTPGACTETELDAFVSFVEKTDDPQKWKDGPWTSNPACRDCVFAKETTTWPPLILNASGQLAELNVGGCIAIASGKEACGKAYQQWRTCYLEACTDCPDGDSNAFSKCVTAANKKACKKAFDDVIPACGDVDTAANAETACDGEKYVFEGPIRAQCIGLGDGDL